MSDNRGQLSTYGTDPLKPVGPGVPRPVTAPSLSEVWSAHRTIGQTDRLDAARDRLRRMYAPLMREIEATSHWWERPVNPSINIDTDRGEALVWAYLKQKRASDPTYLTNLARTRGDLYSGFAKQEREERDAARGVMAREQGATQALVGFGADMYENAVDPMLRGDPATTATMFIGGGGSTAARRIGLGILANAGVAAVSQPVIARNRAAVGENLTTGEGLTNVAVAGAAGGVLHLGGELLAAGAKPAADRARSFAGELAAKVRSVLPPEHRMPEEQAALQALDRQDDILQGSPFRPGRDTDAYAARVEQTAAALAEASKVSNTGYRTPAALAPVPRETFRPPPPAPGLSRDNVIRFVLNTLEGGDRATDLADGGGLTKFGITAANHPGVDVAALTEEGASAIARQRYWTHGMDVGDPRVSAVLFDARFIGGDRALERVARAAQGNDWRAGISAYRSYLATLADTNPAKARYRRGWMHRVDRLEHFIEKNGDDSGPVLRRDQFADDDAGDSDWAHAQRDLDAENDALARAQEASARSLDGDDDFVPGFGDDAPRSADFGADPFGDAAPAPRGDDDILAYWDGRRAAGKRRDAVWAVRDPDGRVVDWGFTERDAQDRIEARGGGLKAERVTPGELPERGAAREVQAPGARGALDEEGLRAFYAKGLYSAAASDPRMVFWSRRDDLLRRFRGRDDLLDPGEAAHLTQALGEERVAALTELRARRAAGEIDTAAAHMAIREDDLTRLAAADQRAGDLETLKIIRRRIARGESRFPAEARVEIERLERSLGLELKAELLEDDAPPEGFDHPDATPPDASVERVDRADDAVAERHIQSLEHDLRMLLDEQPDLSFRVTEDGDVQNLADILAELDADDDAVAAARACLSPKGDAA